MPRSFFNVHDGKAIPDDTGTDLAGIDDSHEEAVKLAGALLRDHGTKFWKGHDWSIDVADETGGVLCLMRFSASINDPDDPTPWGRQNRSYALGLYRVRSVMRGRTDLRHESRLFWLGPPCNV